ncbi:CvpA family protein [Candidatus Berkelbacteria bacterium]|nr:CvpA family protein [Candidatus Berkelbacteria bacterium]
MNFIDVIIVFFILLAIFDGWRAGFYITILDSIAFVISITAAYFGFTFFGDVFGWLFGLSAGLQPFVGFIFVFIILNTILRIGAKRLVNHYSKKQYFNDSSRAGGIIINLVKQLASLALIINLLLFLPALPFVRTGILNSRLSPLLVTSNPRLEQAFAQIIEPAIYESQQFITTTEIDDDPVELDVPVVELKIDYAAELTMVKLVNRERAKVGLEPLIWREDLAEVGRLHSMDMWRRHYFAHINPDGADPFDRIRQAGIKYLVAGENLAVAPSTTIAHQGLMDSPGHRDNILAEDFGHIGIGVVRNGLYGATYTQIFTE